MAYTINLTDGTIFATIADGTINTASSMTLVGKNYAGYGEFLDENFVHLLESSSSSTAPGAPLTGQLWWDKGNNLLKVYNGSAFKVISGATSSSTAPSGGVTGDLWFDTVNQQLKVYTGAAWLLVGPAFTSGQGTTGAIADTITDNVAVSHVVIKLFVEDSLVGIVSKDATFTPAAAISGFTTVKPGITLASSIGAQTPLFQGTALNSQLLDDLDSSQFLRSDAADTTNSTLGVLNDDGLSVGSDSDFRATVSGTTVNLSNQTQDGNLALRINDGGSTTTLINLEGATSTVLPGANASINMGSTTLKWNTIYAVEFNGTATQAEYADVAERYESDEILEAGTVVEIGGSAEVTKAVSELSDNVFGVVSNKPAHLMNARSGKDNDYYPPIAMTGRVQVKVIGEVKKGDRLVSAGEGIARSAKPGEATAFNVVGRSLAAKLDTGLGTVEAIVSMIR